MLLRVCKETILTINLTITLKPHNRKGAKILASNNKVSSDSTKYLNEKTKTDATNSTHPTNTIPAKNLITVYSNFALNFL